MREGTTIQGLQSQENYAWLLVQLPVQFFLAAERSQVFFTTDAELWEPYLASFSDDEERQYHNCHACKNFLTRYGGLVALETSGEQHSVLWNNVDRRGIYGPVIEALNRCVSRAKITGVFISDATALGQARTDEWTHFAVDMPLNAQHQSKVLSPGQRRAELHEDFVLVMAALVAYPAEVINQAIALLDSEALYRHEKVSGPATWLQSLHTARASAHGKVRTNVVWRAVAMAPQGFAHIKSSMIGTLLEDIVGGLPFQTIAQRFAAKMHPLQYQRPQAAPTAGSVVVAEKRIKALGIELSLHRRFARLDEVEAFWRPEAQSPMPSNGHVFGHLVTKGSKAASKLSLPARRYTWTSFARDVLPTAQSIAVKIPGGRINLGSLVTAVNPDAPPILQWDSPEQRNPVSWYVYHGGAPAQSFGLRVDDWVGVSALCFSPWSWNGNQSEHFAQGIFVLLDGARDQSPVSGCLFPEILRGELREVRSVIEAFSQQAVMQGEEDASAAGILAQKGAMLIHMKVHAPTLTSEYLIDRWE